MVLGIVGLIFIVLFGSSMFKTIEPGEKGVIFRKFGGGLDKEKCSKEERRVEGSVVRERVKKKKMKKKEEEGEGCVRMSE